MKKALILNLLLIFWLTLTGCNQVNHENSIDETENIVEEIGLNDVVVEKDEVDNIEESIQRNPNSQRWNLLAFNWSEVNWNYEMEITDNGEIFTKFCNSIWWNISFDGDDEWSISASLIQTEMACEWESMDLENAFKIDWATYSIMADEDWGSTMIIKTDAWDKFIWRKILE